MVMPLPRKMGSAASFRYHAGRARGRAGGDSIYDDPTLQKVMFTGLAIYSLPLVFIAVILLAAALVTGGLPAFLTFAAVVLATAYLRGGKDREIARKYSKRGSGK